LDGVVKRQGDAIRLGRAILTTVHNLGFLKLQPVTTMADKTRTFPANFREPGRWRLSNLRMRMLVYFGLPAR
jgi:hypothetical protein